MSYGVLGAQSGLRQRLHGVVEYSARLSRYSCRPYKDSDVLQVQNNILDYMGGTAQKWQWAIGNGTENMLKKPDTLLKWIDGGLTFPSGVDFDESVMDIGQSMTKFPFASALPAIW